MGLCQVAMVPIVRKKAKRENEGKIGKWKQRNETGTELCF
jgi:hypothetical protein